MTYVCAQKYDIMFADFLRSAGGVVHSVFPRAVNILCNGTLYTILAGKNSVAPCTANVDTLNFQDVGICVGDLARVIGKNVVLEEKLMLHCNDVVLLTPFFQQIPFRVAKIRRSLSLFETYLGKKTECYGAALFYQKYYIGKPIDVDCVQQQLNQRIEATIQAFPKQQQIRSAAKKLIGAGIGLTPSGDDFLCGMLLAFDRSATPAAKRFLAFLIDGIKNAKELDLTTDVSRQMIQFHMQGKSPELYQKFISSLLYGGHHMEAFLLELEEVGQSSGLDFACGAASGFQLLLQYPDE